MRISNGGLGRVGNGAVVLQSGLHQLAERAERRTGRNRIGGVGRDQQRRTLAAPHRALEAARDFDTEQHAAIGNQTIELGFVS